MAKVKIFQKAEKVKFTAGRIADFHCPKDKPQVFLWCNEPLGLAVRATTKGSKTYIFQTKVNRKSMRMTIGDIKTWSIEEARAETRRLQVIVDQGSDPRLIKAEKKDESKKNLIDRKLLKVRESVTFDIAWNEYIKDRKSQWSERHYQDHITSIHPGGKTRKKSKDKTIPGVLASFLKIRLVDITSERIEEWAKTESKNRPARARLALRLLKAFMFWCIRHPTYKNIISINSVQDRTIREKLGKPEIKNDVLQREQLSAWFEVVQQIQNPVISAYLQILLLIGSRREELANLQWVDIDFQWKSITMKDKVDGQRIIPLTFFVESLLLSLPKRNKWVFSSPTASSGRLSDPRIAHKKACAIAGLDMTLHGLRRSFASLCEWIEMPVGIAAQIQGHRPQGVREKNYIRRPLDLLRKWHIKIEEWILEQANIKCMPVKNGIHLVSN